MAEKKTKPGAKAAHKKAAPKAEIKKTAAKKESPKPALRSAAQCIFDLYNIKFGMMKSAIEELFAIGAEGFLQEEQLLHTKAQWIQLYFDHQDRLWQVKASYLMGSPEEAEALLETMSQNYKMQTPSTRIAFELGDEDGNNMAELQIRYSEANLKRIYFHHMMAVGAAKREAEEERERIIKEKEEEEYIPSGPLIF